MDNYLLPYLLLMAHFVSGALWRVRINRRLNTAEAKMQWTKFLVYLLIVNLAWCCLIWEPLFFPFIGWIVILIASAEWWKALGKVQGRFWLILAFLMVTGGFIGFLYMDQKLILYTYFVVVLFDGSSQIAGQLVGKRSLLPRISPRKTWEGLMGGAVITLATTLLTRRSFSYECGELILWTAVIMAAAFTGDMLASAVKRKAKIATFGRVLPGHGGMIDRFDSLMMAGSLLYVLSLIQHWLG